MGKKIYSFILFFLFSSLFTINAQKESLVTPVIDSILIKVDKDIENEKFKDATLIIDSLKNIKKYQKNNFDRLAIDLRYAQLLYEREENKKAMHLLLDGVSQLENYSNSKLTWLYNKYLTTIFFTNENYKRAYFYAQKNIENAHYRKDTIDIIESFFSKGRGFYIQLNSIYDSEPDVGKVGFSNPKYKMFADSSYFYSKKATNLTLNTATFEKISLAYILIGNIFFYSNQPTLAKKNYEKSLKIIDKYNPKNNLLIANTLTSLANILYSQKKYTKGLKKYKKAYYLLEKSKQKKHLKSKSSILQNIAWSYEELEEYKLAYEFQKKANHFTDTIALINQSRDIDIIETKYLESQKTEIEKNKRLKTQLYFLGFAFITLIIGIFVYIIYKRLKNKQHKTERSISGLKYKALNAQMSPHFINNLLLCIHDLIDTDKKEIAIKHLDKFNRLTNLVLRSTKSNLISLSKEIEMLELYLDLQLLRFNNQFDYVINTKEIAKKDVESIKIPPLILQPIVENSIVHGFRSMETKGKLLIDFTIKNEDYIICTIVDNGRETPESLNPEMYTKNGISLKNINERLQLITQKKIDTKLVVITTIKDASKEVIGFKIELNIPLIYN